MFGFPQLAAVVTKLQPILQHVLGTVIIATTTVMSFDFIIGRASWKNSTLEMATPFRIRKSHTVL